MRDPKRIQPLLAALTEYWTQHPDWRLGQIVCNCGREIGHWDPFYMEDDQLLGVIRAHLRTDDLPFTEEPDDATGDWGED